MKSTVLIAATVIGLCLLALSPCQAQPTLAVDFDQKTVTPANPIFNRELGETVVVSVKSADPIKASIDLPKYSATENSADTIDASNFVINIKSCPRKSTGSRQGAIDNATKLFSLMRGQSKSSTSVSDLDCPYAVLDYAGGVPVGWSVYLRKDATFSIHLAKDGNAPSPFNVPLQVVSKPFALEFSMGLSFLGSRDQRFRLDAPKNAADQSESTITRVSDGDLSYKVAAFAHYTLVTIPWFGFVAGLGTDVPSGNLAPMLGVSFSAQTVPILDKGHILVGAAFAQRKELKAQYEGISTVPSSTTIDSLTESRSKITYFFGISFDFFKGEDKFKALFPGSGNGTPAQ